MSDPLTPSQSSFVLETLRVSLAAAAADVSGEHLHALARAAAALAPGTSYEPHPGLPTVGSSVTADRTVGPDDTAAAMGHPDTSVRVLGSPRLALWFELVSCELIPTVPGTSHLGAGILVHHLGRADVGETVTVECTTASVSGKRVVFTCRALVGDRLVGLGTHHRALVVED